MLRHSARFIFNRVPAALMVALLAMILALAALPMDSLAQMAAAMTLLGVMWYCRTAAADSPEGFHRLLTLTLGTLIALRYISWRAIYTLGSRTPLDLVFTLILFGAEAYTLVLYLLGLIVNTKPLDRVELSLNDLPPGTILPTVDVLVPSYNEDAALLEVTLRAAMAMQYPAGRMRVYLLDDGGTDQKLNDPDPRKAKSAHERRQTMQALCTQLGVGYIARQRNERAKSGNVNNGLQYTDGDLVVILDADHVPTLDFLDYTVPWFVLQGDVFLVQTPHFMINPDPIDRNLLRSFRRMPSENDMFYQTIQRGLDFWSSSFFCGSAAVLRRRHLDEIGGLHGDSITEDAESALALHQKGYRSIYVARPMVAGLAPETFTAFVIQRMRWAQGMTQILLLKKPFLMPGLRWYQRVGYMSSLVYWLFPFARLIFLLAPLAYLLFGVEVYNASIGEIIAYALPYILANYTVSHILYGRTRWPLVSEIYEIMQCVFSLNAIIQVLRNPRKPAFVVTPKGDTLEEDFISPLSRPFYLLNIAVLLGFIGGAWRFYAYPLTRDLTIVVLLWNLFNYFTISAALGALFERRQRRSAPRMPVQEPGWIYSAEKEAVDCEIDDLSAGGARILIDPRKFSPTIDEVIDLVSYSVPLDRNIHIPCRVRAAYPLGRRIAVGLRFEKTSEQVATDAVLLAFGDSARWRFFQQRRQREFPFWMAFRMVLHLAGEPVMMHLRKLGESAVQRLSRRTQPSISIAAKEAPLND